MCLMIRLRKDERQCVSGLMLTKLPGNLSPVAPRVSGASDGAQCIRSVLRLAVWPNNLGPHEMIEPYEGVKGNQ